MNPIRRLAKISRRKFFISRSPGSLGGPYETVQIQATTVAIPKDKADILFHFRQLFKELFGVQMFDCFSWH